MTTLYDFRSSEIESTLDPKDPSVIWIVVLGYVIAFFLAFGVGRLLHRLRKPCRQPSPYVKPVSKALTAAILIPIRITVMRCRHDMPGSRGAIWNLVATFAGMPISGTHSIVGAMVGFSVVAKGFDSIKWIEIAKIGKSLDFSSII
ncbi:unnamed protein product [Oppiella nova]|uniref:Uncharacterized protein n=1 Tax=Oppiella nova TaxID=334625 RepID=A0A7R9LSU4_9ACAR|nr:unnamed protein product [Oppiella nova]CAG2166605.1 unnamed protein product [Oppiella nova]